ncbi:MAG: hypothetical protein H7841_14590 [Magnetospirillum sp. WYHS-4]
MLKNVFAIALTAAAVAVSGVAMAAEQYVITDYERVLISPVPCADAKKAIDDVVIDVPVAPKS